MNVSPLQVSVKNWITENQDDFLPPVCNKLMHFSQLLIMFVGGPNTRKDYHIEEGEEMFLLPARVPHSPQRQANTVGLVVERRRLLTETDCLRYYVDNTTNILFERWFYCENLGTQLVPIIKEFMASEECRTGKPNPKELFRDPPFQLNSVSVMQPFSFKDWLEQQRSLLGGGSPVSMFGDQFETEVLVFGPGLTETSVQQTDAWIWQMEGSSRVTINQQEFTLSAGDSLLITEQSQYQWERNQGTVALFVVQNPERKKP
uniref:3-hydroxyanthranilate 3,4-dioxygenase n=1 Tax=Nothobranchius furzeri TaxID=105023 RepID=A0A8C6K657_NOTFU